MILERARWEEFVEGTGIGKVGVFQYYLNGDPRVSVPNNVPYEQVLAGLFADAVTVGALSLPHGRTLEDFDFQMAIAKTYRDQEICVRLKNEPGRPSSPLLNHFYFFDYTTPMVSDCVFEAIKAIGKGIGALNSAHNASLSRPVVNTMLLP